MSTLQITKYCSFTFVDMNWRSNQNVWMEQVSAGVWSKVWRNCVRWCLTWMGPGGVWGWHCVICWHMKDKCSLLPPFILMHTPSLILHFNMKLSVKYYLHICIFFIHPSFISRLLSFFSLHGNIFCWELFSVTEWINEKTQNPELLF